MMEQKGMKLNKKASIRINHSIHTSHLYPISDEPKMNYLFI